MLREYETPGICGGNDYLNVSAEVSRDFRVQLNLDSDLQFVH